MTFSKLKVLDVSCGWRHSVGIVEGPHVYSWGRGASGQLGHGNNEEVNTPKLIQKIEEILTEGPAKYAQRTSSWEKSARGSVSTRYKHQTISILKTCCQ